MYPHKRGLKVKIYGVEGGKVVTLYYDADIEYLQLNKMKMNLLSDNYCYWPGL